MNPPEPGGSKSPGPMRYAGLGIQLAATVAISALLGSWADRKLGTGGIITIAAVFLGFGGTMYSLVRTLNKKDDEGS